jgi:hypothetical protein
MDALPDFLLSEVASFLRLEDLLEFVSALGARELDHTLRVDVVLAGPPADTVGLALALRRRARAIEVRRMVLAAPAVLSHAYPLLQLAPQLPQLRSVDVTGVTLSYSSLAALERVGHLTELDVSHVTVTGGAPQAPAAAPPAFAATLRRLGFVGTWLARRWPLQWFGGLRCFTGRFMDPIAVTDLALCRALQELELHGTRVCNLRIYGPAWRSVLAGLTALTFRECDLLPRPHLQQQPWDVLCEVLEQAPRLAALALVDTWQPSVGDGLLAEALPLLSERVQRSVHGGHLPLPPLSVAYGYAGHQPAPSLPPAEYYSHVEAGCGGDLVVGRDDGGGSGGTVKPGAGFTALTISPSQALTDKSLGLIAEHLGPTLQTLALGPYNPRLTDSGLSALVRGCPRLQRLELPFAGGITDTGVLAVAAAAGALQALSISRCSIMSAAPLGALADGCPRLRELHVRGCHAAMSDTSDGGGGGGHAALKRLRDRGCVVHYTPHPLVGTTTERALATGSASPCAPRERVACGAGCGALVAPVDVVDHVEVCVRSTVRCLNWQDGCGWTAERGDVGAAARHYAECPHWVVCCSAGCGEQLPRSAMPAHLERHAHEVEAAALVPRCPHAGDGCDCPPAELADGTHLSAGRCEYAAYACASCGVTQRHTRGGTPAGAVLPRCKTGGSTGATTAATGASSGGDCCPVRQRWASCGTPECAAVGLTRAVRVPAADGAGDHLLPYPPSVLARGLSPSLLLQHRLMPPPPPPLADDAPPSGTRLAVEVGAVLAALESLLAAQQAGGGGDGGPTPPIAVTPFANLGGKPDAFVSGASSAIVGSSASATSAVTPAATFTTSHPPRSTASTAPLSVVTATSPAVTLSCCSPQSPLRRWWRRGEAAGETCA